MRRKQKRPSVWKAALYLLVPGGGFEPPHLAAAVFESELSEYPKTIRNTPKHWQQGLSPAVIVSGCCG